jgi:prephenate dehydrogenase
VSVQHDLALGTARVVGTGLLGTSVALGLRASGTEVVLADPSASALELACAMGAGRVDDGATDVDLVVVAAPPAATAGAVLAELVRHPHATVTDVASVKVTVLDAVRAAGGDLTRYVGGHPMAGRERSGPGAARGDLFAARPWVICPTAESTDERLGAVRRLAELLGAVPVTMSAQRHDEAVAVVSHLPQVAASLVAARLTDVDDEVVALAGGGLRDVTRIAASDPELWQQILTGNAAPLRGHLAAMRNELDRAVAALDAVLDQGQAAGRDALRDLVAAGNAGRDRIPGKHGGTATRYAVVVVVVPDAPGSLARLFHDVGAAGINVEELVLEHAPGRAVGLVEVSVVPAAREALTAALVGAGWTLAG